MSELNWYVAEYVIAVGFNGDDPHEYRIDNYLIKAVSAQEAYQKAVDLKSHLSQSHENEFGDVENYSCIGFHELDEHWDANNSDVIHINTIDLLYVTGNPPKPRIKEKDELLLFSRAKS